MKCEQCQSEFSSLRGLHSHIGRAHGDLQSYYWKFFPKRDFYSQELIKFTDLESYLSTDFNSKENFAKWCYSANNNEVREYVISQFKARAEKKSSKNFPSQVELKSLFLPSWYGLISIFGSLENVIKNLEPYFVFKYNYNHQPIFTEVDETILIDTREQNPLKFKNSRIQKLSCGDYSTSGELFSDVFIERKSLNDLASTLSVGKERFIREIERAKKLNYYLVVLVEEEFSSVLELNPQNSYSKFINGKYLLFCIREILTQHDNIQFVFSGSRQKSYELVPKIFQLKDQVKFLDLEYLKDFNKI